MSFTPIPSRSRSLNDWFATRPELFTRLGLPRRIVLGSIMTVVGIVGGAVLAWLWAAGAIRADSGSQLPVLALLLLVPVGLLGAGVWTLTRGSFAWTVNGGSPMREMFLHSFGDDLPVEPLLATLAAGREGDPRIAQALAAVVRSPHQGRLLAIASSREDRVLAAGVLRVVGNDVSVVIDHEPVLVTGDRWFDVEPYRLATAGTLPPAPEAPVAAPSPTTAAPAAPPSPTTADGLAPLVLSADGLRRYREAIACLEAEGFDVFAERHPDVADPFDEDELTPILVLIGVGGQDPAPTLGWCDAGGEDEPGQVCRQVDAACRALGLPAPTWEPAMLAGTTDAASLLRQVDRRLADTGLRLLFIDPDSDQYVFVPVRADEAARLDGTQGEGFVLRSAPAMLGG